MKRAFPVSVFLPFALAFGRSILRGVQRYASHRPDWRVIVSDTAHAPPPRGTIGGLVAAVSPGVWSDFATDCKAAVNISNSMLHSPVPQVVSDDVAIGKLAAEHLLQQGFQRFLFLNPTPCRFALQRREGFFNVLTAAGRSCTEIENSGEAIPRLLKTEKPAAVFAVTDTIARLHIQQLVERGIRVPEEVAMMGVDDDEFESQISPVPLSSVAPDGERIGYEAARLLDRLSRGGKPPAQPITIPPLYVVARRSTDRFSSSHPVVAKALRLMKTQAAQFSSVDAVAAAVGVGRRTLERHFQSEIGLPVYPELCRAKLEAVMPAILRGTDTMSQIATRAGFTDARLFNNVCVRIFGKTPGQLRREASVRKA